MSTSAAERSLDKTPPREPRGAERRADPRLHFSADIGFASGDNFYAGRTRDISAGGLFFETTAPLEVGDRIWIRLKILDAAFAVTAVVAWLLADRVGRPRGAGVRFLHVPAPMRAAIATFMAQRAPIQFEFEASGDAPPREPPPLGPARGRPAPKE